VSANDPDALDVCVVEDERRLRTLLVREIAAMGHRSAGFASAEDAWEPIRAGVDVVLLDLNLPGMSGMDLLERIRQHNIETAVVILTGFGGFESAVQSLRWKAEDYLTKPCSLADIDRVLSRLLSRKRAARRQQAIVETQPEVAYPLITALAPGGDSAAPRAPRTVEELERAHILEVLAAHPNDKRSAAAELGISLRTLYYKIAAYRQQGFLH